MKLDCTCEVDVVNVEFFLNCWDEKTFCYSCGIEYLAIGDDPNEELVNVFMGLCGHVTDVPDGLCTDCC